MEYLILGERRSCRFVGFAYRIAFLRAYIFQGIMHLGDAALLARRNYGAFMAVSGR
jgi:hypothetical protein